MERLHPSTRKSTKGSQDLNLFLLFASMGDGRVLSVIAFYENAISRFDNWSLSAIAI
jgi:hypothetical protein